MCLLSVKGHAYNHDAFLAMFAEDADIVTTLVEQPAAQGHVETGKMLRVFDAVFVLRHVLVSPMPD